MNTSRTLAYGALGLPLAFVALPLYVHVPHLYASNAGLGLALLGGLLLAARLFDAVIDPLLGWLADRCSRPLMMVLALLPLAGGFVALLHPPATQVELWLVLALLVTYTGYSAVSVAYQALGADLGINSSERTRLTAAREGFGLLGVLAAASLPALLASTMAEGLMRLAWIFVPLLLIAAVLTLAVRPLLVVRSSAMPLWPALRLTLGDGAYRRLLIIFIANGIAAALPATLVLFFVADILHASDYAGAFLALYFVAGVAGLPLWLRLAARIGRVRAWLGGMLLAGVAFVAAFALGPGDGVAFAFVCLATGLALGADIVFPAAMAADLGEAQGRPGAFFGCWNLVAKLNLALAAGLALPLLAWLGYQPGVVGGEAALSATYALLPLVFKLLAALLLWHWASRLEKIS